VNDVSRENERLQMLLAEALDRIEDLRSKVTRAPELVRDELPVTRGFPRWLGHQATTPAPLGTPSEPSPAPRA